MGPISCSSPFHLLKTYQAFPPGVVTAITKGVAFAIAHNLRAAGFSGYFSASSDGRPKSAPSVAFCSSSGELVGAQP